MKKIYPNEQGVNRWDSYNIQAKKAEEDYLLFLQEGDNVVEEELDCEASWFYGRTQIVDDCGKPLISFLYFPHKRYRLYREHFIPLSATVISRELFWEVGGFRTDLEMVADYELFLRLAKRSDPVAIPQVITHVRERLLNYHEKIARINEAHQVRREHVKAPHDRLFGFWTWRRQLRRARSLSQS